MIDFNGVYLVLKCQTAFPNWSVTRVYLPDCNQILATTGFRTVTLHHLHPTTETMTATPTTLPLNTVNIVIASQQIHISQRRLGVGLATRPCKNTVLQKQQDKSDTDLVNQCLIETLQNLYDSPNPVPYEVSYFVGVLRHFQHK